MSVVLPDSELLVGIAALGLTVTGFSGLVSVLGRRADGRWSESERFQLKQLVEISLAVTFSAFIPILAGLAAPAEMALPIATAAVAVVHLVVMVRGVSSGVLRQGPAVAALTVPIVAAMVGGGSIMILASGAAMAVVNLGAQSYRKGEVYFVDAENRGISTNDPGWAAKWEAKSKARELPNHIAGWKAGDFGSKLDEPEYMSQAGPWVDGKDPAGS